MQLSLQHAALVCACLLMACAKDGGGPDVPPPPPPAWIEPSSMVGTWQYRAYYMYQAGCWPEGGGTVCLLDSTLEAVDGTVVLGPARDSSFGATYKSWKVPYHLEITIRQWDVLGACNGAPLSCFTARAPTATGTDIRDSIFEIGQDASLPAGIMLRDGHAQWYWTTAVVHPTRLYDSVAAAAPPAHPGVHELQKQP